MKKRFKQQVLTEFLLTVVCHLKSTSHQTSLHPNRSCAYDRRENSDSLFVYPSNCETAYVGRRQRVPDHHSAWLKTEVIREIITVALLAPFCVLKHLVNVTKEFRPICKFSTR